jgi:hypothetical protein
LPLQKLQQRQQHSVWAILRFMKTLTVISFGIKEWEV